VETGEGQTKWRGVRAVEVERGEGQSKWRGVREGQSKWRVVRVSLSGEG